MLLHAGLDRGEVFAEVLDEQRIDSSGKCLLRRIERLDLAHILEIRAELVGALVHEVVH